MNILYAPRQSGRTTMIMNQALIAAMDNRLSVIVVPTGNQAVWVKSKLKEFNTGLEDNVLVMTFYQFVQGSNRNRLAGHRNVKIFIDDLDGCLENCTGGYGTIDTVIFERG